MNKNTSSASMLSAAAAGLAAVSLGSSAGEARADVVWNPGPIDLPGTYERSDFTEFTGSSTTYRDDIAIDFDEDGLVDFIFFYYNSFKFTTYRDLYIGDNFNNPLYPNLNPNADVIYNPDNVNTSNGGMTWYVYPLVFNDLNVLYASGSGFTPDAGYLAASALSNEALTVPSEGLVGGVFTGGDNQQYVAYVQFEITPPTSEGAYDQQLIILDSGYAAVPEPTAAAILGLGGLALSIRRRR